ncbi:hypothetical protein, partial [Moraxella catarrhalis]|uniref:hypothetical protein n=2 Tax=Moraxella catarrhalis TaxID=480 RepID=UPI001D0D8B36
CVSPNFKKIVLHYNTLCQKFKLWKPMLTISINYPKSADLPLLSKRQATGTSSIVPLVRSMVSVNSQWGLISPFTP